MRGLIGGLLCLLLCWLGAAAPVAALGLPGRSAPAAPTAPLRPGGGTAPLQEVAPPPAVEQLQEALAERQPQVEILEPRDQAMLGPEPWTLRVAVRDWPLVDGGPLGLGPHLVVQLDGAPPQPITTPEVTLPPLSPGSHRLTVYAARPWGEAVKSPGAQAQIRLHRAAANPLTLPASGSPQLIPVQPAGASRVAAEPVLIDWLLLDAPLQHLRDGDDRWRLRLTVNGDSVLVDRSEPLWLRGWRRGANAVQLELLDGSGEPLNPPFNAVVAELTLTSGEPPPAWLQGPLTATERAVLLGEAPPDALEPRQSAEAPEAPPPHPAPIEEPAAEQPAAESAVEQGSGAAATEASADDTVPAEPVEPEPVEPAPAAGEPVPTAAAEGAEAAPPPLPQPPAAPPARDQVRADGTLIRSQADGPLAGLRQRLQR